MSNTLQNINTYIESGRFGELISSLIQEIDNSSELEAAGLMTALVRINDLFVVVSKDGVAEVYKRNKNKIKADVFDVSLWVYPIWPSIVRLHLNYKKPDRLSFVCVDVTREPMGILIGMGSARGLPPVSDTDFSKITNTVFQFVVPFKIKGIDNTSVYTDNLTNTVFTFKDIKSFLDNPFFDLFRHLIFGGNTAGHILELLLIKNQVFA